MIIKKLETYEDFESYDLLKLRNKALNEYRKCGTFTDVKLLSTDNQTLKAHKNVLSATCKYFRTMFKLDNVNSRLDTIQLTNDITFSDLEIILEYLYTGKIRICIENARNLYMKSQFLELDDLNEFCTQMLIKTISFENCLELWRFSEKYVSNELKVASFKFIVTNGEIFLDKFCLDLTYDEIKAITARNCLVIDAEKLYLFLTKWVKADFEARADYLIVLLDESDFLNISDEFYEREIIGDNLLHSNCEYAALMRKVSFQKFTEAKKKLAKIEEKINPETA